MFNGDNATSNNKQMTYLDKLPNAFKEVNHVCCFNHTMQLSAKALMKPFDTPMASANSDGSKPPDANDMFSSELDNNNSDDSDEEDSEGGIDTSSVGGNDRDDGEGEDVDNDPFEALDADAQQELLEGTAAVRTTLNKVCSYPSFYHVHISFALLSDPKTFLCHYTLYDNYTSCMA